MPQRQIPDQRVQDIGEQGLLEQVQRFCPAEIVGDDAAILSTDSGKLLAISTDMLVDGVHFSLGLASPGRVTTSPEDVGWRAAAANLSDLAAMGATPLGITIALGLCSNIPVSWVEKIYQGLTACLQKYNTILVGGDICRSNLITLSITAFGQVDPDKTIRRTSAQVGDAIVATGVHGSSRAGLELLLHPERGHTLSDAERETLIQTHQRPLPRLDVSLLLPALQLNSTDPFRIAGMDSSDGLADAVLQICRASHVGATLDASQIPISPTVEQFVDSEQAMHWALYGGEDFELILCLAPDFANRLVKKLGGSARIVGTIIPDPNVWLTDSTDPSGKALLSMRQGFQHF